MVTLSGHTGAITNIKVLNSGYLVSSSLDGTIKIWDYGRSPYLKMTLTGHTAAVTCLEVLQGGFFASGSDDATVIIWDADLGTNVQSFNVQNSSVNYLRMLPDGRLAVASDDRSIYIYYTHPYVDDAYYRMALTGHSQKPILIDVLPTGNLVTTTLEGQMYYWKMSTGKTYKTKTDTSSSFFEVMISRGKLKIDY